MRRFRDVFPHLPGGAAAWLLPIPVALGIGRFLSLANGERRLELRLGPAWSGCSCGLAGLGCCGGSASDRLREASLRVATGLYAPLPGCLPSLAWRRRRLVVAHTCGPRHRPVLVAGKRRTEAGTEARAGLDLAVAAGLLVWAAVVAAPPIGCGKHPSASRRTLCAASGMSSLTCLEAPPLGCCPYLWPSASAGFLSLANGERRLELRLGRRRVALGLRPVDLVTAGPLRSPLL